MGSSKTWRIRGLFLTIVLTLCLCLAASADREVDEDGGIWDWDNMTYTPSGGSPVPIIDEDGTGAPSGSSQSAPAQSTPAQSTPAQSVPATSQDSGVVRNDDGSVTVVTDEKDIIWNDDGSITLEDGQIQILPQEDENALSGDEAWAQGMMLAARANGDYTRTLHVDNENHITEVYVEYLGLVRSQVILNGQRQLVDTFSLVWETDAPSDQTIAVVTARTYARLFAKSTKKSLIMDKILPGTALRVLSTGKNWTFVDYNGIRGYVQTPSVTFYRNEPRQYKAGYVATKSGHIYGDSTTHVRNSPNGRQQEEYRVGTPIAILSDDGKWCQIDVNGHFCYIQRDFVMYEDDLAAAAMAEDGV